MSEKFTARDWSLSDINGGYRYENGNFPDADSANMPIELSAYARQVAIGANAIAMSAKDKVDGALGANSAYSLLDAYPVGSVYLSMNAISPAQLFGGTWERIAEDSFLLGVGSVFSTDSRVVGGAGVNDDSVGRGEIALTEKELPKHKHQFRNALSSTAVQQPNDTGKAQATYASATWGDNWDGVGGEVGAINWAGESSPFSIMPPYCSVYMWERVG